jgi:hypothetical protein
MFKKNLHASCFNLTGSMRMSNIKGLYLNLSPTIFFGSKPKKQASSSPMASRLELLRSKCYLKDMCLSQAKKLGLIHVSFKD